MSSSLRVKRVSLRGFTLVEMLMSVSVMTVLTTILVYKYPETNVRIQLANSNQEVSFLLREAQIRGSAVDSANGIFGGAGAYFNLATPTQAILFGDSIDPAIPEPNGLPVGNGLYEESVSFGLGTLNEIRATTTFPTDYVISKLCVGGSFPFTCNNYGIALPQPVPNIQTLTVSFVRPNPQPHIYINNATTTDYPGACIEMRSPKAPPAGEEFPSGHIRSVQIYNSGSIRTFKGRCDTNF
jgi:prepilin-type N-terminal cleavage/methylation domain-containing protein